MQDPIEFIRGSHQDCITSSCKENKCSLRLDGVSPTSFAIIHGTKYQKNNKFAEKLCDRIIFYHDYDLILMAVELKGGNTIHLRHAIDQIQNGLNVANGLLGTHTVADWVPLLVYSGHMSPHEIKLLQTKGVQFQGKKKIVVKCDCDTRLSAILWS